MFIFTRFMSTKHLGLSVSSGIVRCLALFHYGKRRFFALFALGGLRNCPESFWNAGDASRVSNDISVSKDVSTTEIFEFQAIKACL